MCCCDSGDDTDATAQPCYLHSLHLFKCLCIFELRDVESALAIHKTHTLMLMIPIPIPKPKHIYIYRCATVLFFFVSNMSSVVRSASLICYTAIAVCVYVFSHTPLFFFFFLFFTSSFLFFILFSVSLSSSLCVCVYDFLLSVHIEKKTHQNIRESVKMRKITII